MGTTLEKEQSLRCSRVYSLWQDNSALPLASACAGPPVPPPRAFCTCSTGGGLLSPVLLFGLVSFVLVLGERRKRGMYKQVKFKSTFLGSL